MALQLYRSNNEDEINSFHEAVKYWSNGMGELHRQGVDITEDELPPELKRVYDELYFECGTDTSAICYLVQTQNGYGIGLCYEYDDCYADDYALTMDQLFESAKKDAENIASKPEFSNAEILLGEYMGFDGCHELTVILPASISVDDFKKAAKLLDTLTLEDARSRESNLKPYVVTVTETFQRTVVIYAQDNYHAEELAEELCNNDDINLDGNDFITRRTSADGIATEHDLSAHKIFGLKEPEQAGIDLNFSLTKAQSTADNRPESSFSRKQDTDRSI